jgi:hypothetical protein
VPLQGLAKLLAPAGASVLTDGSSRTIARQNATNAARRVGNVTGVTRNEMNMNMHARLAGSAADVCPNVVTVWGMLRLNELARAAEQFDNGHFLG